MPARDRLLNPFQKVFDLRPNSSAVKVKTLEIQKEDTTNEADPLPTHSIVIEGQKASLISTTSDHSIRGRDTPDFVNFGRTKARKHPRILDRSKSGIKTRRVDKQQSWVLRPFLLRFPPDLRFPWLEIPFDEIACFKKPTKRIWKQPTRL